MTQIKLNLDEGQTKIVNMCKLVNSLDSKEKAISKIILDWGTIQSLSDKEIHNKVIQYFKDRWSAKQTHNKRDWIKECESDLKKAYKEYNDNIAGFNDLMIKKYKLSSKFITRFMSEDAFTDDESEMQDTNKADKKIKVKIFNEFQDLVSRWQEEIGKKYHCEIEHEEGFWNAKQSFGCLTIKYGGGKECDFYLDSYVNEVILELTKILRGGKSLRNIMDENRAYLERMELESKDFKDPTPDEEAEADAAEELSGI